MKILIVSQDKPYPPLSGSRIIAYNWAKVMGQEHLVAQIFFGTNRDLEAIEKNMEMVRTSRAIRPEPIDRYFRKTKMLFSSYPTSFGNRNWQKMCKCLMKLKSKFKWDVAFYIHSNCIRISSYIDIKHKLPGKNVVVPIDSRTLNLKKRIKSGESMLRKMYYKREISKWKHVYRKEIKNFDSSLFVSKEDKKNVENYVPEGNDHEVYYANNGVDTKYYDPSNVDSMNLNGNSTTLVFSGSMKSKQSIAAVQKFTAVYRKLKENLNIKWYIVGKEPSKTVKSLGNKYEGVVVTGYVSDIRPYLKCADVYVAPMVSGTGVKNRVLEAMSMKCCVLVTTEGLWSSDTELPVVAVNTVPEMEKMVKKLDEDRKLRKNIGEKARRYVHSKYRWKRQVEKAIGLAI